MKTAGLGVGAVLVVVSAVLVAVQSPAAAAGILVAIAMMVVIGSKPELGSPILLVVASVFTRPNLLGSQYASVSLVIVSAAALLAFSSDHFSKARPPRNYVWTVPVWIGLSYVAILVAQSVGERFTQPAAWAQGAILATVTLAACVIVLADPARRLLVAKLFIALIAVLSVSYVVTAGMWFITGPSVGQIGLIDTGAGSAPQPVFFPLTPTVGEIPLPGGIILPRFTGLGREPGWMAMYTAFAFFLAPRIGWGRLSLRVILFIGLLGTFSTAGFGVFAVVAVYNTFLRKHRNRSGATTGLIRTVGLAAMAAALWLAINAPVIGLGAKSASDRGSVGQRTEATLSGIQALGSSPFTGGGATEIVGGVNLIATIALHGVLFTVAITLAIWLPRRKHLSRSATTAPVAVVFLTLLTSQPPTDSTWVFVCVMVAYAATNSAPAQLSVEGLRQTRIRK